MGSPLAALVPARNAHRPPHRRRRRHGRVFFLILVSLTPFAIGPDLNLLARIGPAILWIAALLATLLGLDRLFQADAEDGSLDLFTMSATPLELVVLVKCAAHWWLTALPLIVAAPVLGLTLGLEPAALAGVAASLLAGTPALTLLGRDWRGLDGRACGAAGC